MLFSAPTRSGVPEFGLFVVFRYTNGPGTRSVEKSAEKIRRAAPLATMSVAVPVAECPAGLNAAVTPAPAGAGVLGKSGTAFGAVGAVALLPQPPTSAATSIMLPNRNVT